MQQKLIIKLLMAHRWLVRHYYLKKDYLWRTARGVRCCYQKKHSNGAPPGGAPLVIVPLAYSPNPFVPPLPDPLPPSPHPHAHPLLPPPAPPSPPCLLGLHRRRPASSSRAATRAQPPRPRLWHRSASLPVPGAAAPAQERRRRSYVGDRSIGR